MNSDNPIMRERGRLEEMLNDCSIDRTMAIDVNWNIIAWNRACEEATGIDRKSILGKSLLEIFPLVSNDREMMNAIHRAFTGHKSFVPPDKKFVHRQRYESYFIPLKENGDKVIGVMSIMHDVAHRIKAEKQLQALNAVLEKKYMQLERLTNELARFTYIANRDIREPLKFVYTSFELLVKSEVQNLSDNSKARIRRMQGSLNKMNLLLDDILLLFHISSSRLNTTGVDCNRLLAEVVGGMSKKIAERRVEIKAGDLPVITGDRDMLHYLFAALLGNAIKFQPPGHTPVVRITTGLAPEACLSPASGEPIDCYRISFADNGIGFDQPDAEKIFTLFEQLHDRTAYGGSGIGLTVCRKIAEAHDGFITAEGHPGQGATFHCYFPVTRED